MLSLEARIAPKKQPSKLYHEIFQTDQLVYLAEHERQPEQTAFFPPGGQTQSDKVRLWSKGAPYFYVLHFIKSPDKLPRTKQYIPHQVRNYATRTNARQMALSLSSAMRQSGYLRSRIRGIDAASFEIGCRPEVFATEFRFMKSLPAVQSRRRPVFDGGAFPRIGITYHVGEDFLDIADGLRAIDEAVQFLGMERGDRLGHALAMGVDPERHYWEKGNQIFLPKQDRLDNLVWMLFRSVELGIRLDVGLQEKLRMEAEELLEYLYGAFLPREIVTVSLQKYYESWSLRGDHPECYRTPLKLAHSSRFIPPGSYSSFMYRSGSQLELRRRREELRYLCYLYHFDPEVRRHGAEIAASTVDRPYIELMRALQDRLQKHIGDLGIMVECNPTSNYLIGTFRRYDEHPIFRFNSFGFGGEREDGQLSVSINTDDQGVFDTSLENEYALLACSMSKALTSDGTRRYSRDIIYQYLNHIRRMGNEQCF
mgnify:FL=1